MHGSRVLARTLLIALLCAGVLICGARRRRAVGHPSTPPVTVVLVAGSGMAGAVDGDAASAQFSSPRGVAWDPLRRSIVVADTANHTIRRIENGQVTTIGGAPLEAGARDGVAAEARFRLPHGIAVDATGRVWICDTANHAIRRIETDGTTSTIAGAAGNAGDTDGAAASSRLRFPEGIAIDSDGSVIVADTGNHKLRRITGDGVATIPTASPLRSPSAVAFGRDGALHVVERENRAVRRIARDGVESTVAAGLHTPAGIAVLEETYVADACDHTVKRFPGGTVVVDGLSFPGGLAPGDGEVLIADTRHHAVRALRGVR